MLKKFKKFKKGDKPKKTKTGRVGKRKLLPTDPKKRKRLIIIVVLLVTAVTLGLIFGLYLLAIQPVEEKDEGDSEFVIKDYVTREEIALTMSIYKPSTNMKDYEDTYNIANFEVSSIEDELAEDCDLDVTKYNKTNEDDDYSPIVWVKVNGEGNYRDQWFAISTKFNAEYVLYMYPLSDDVRFNIINKTTRADGLPTTNGTYIISSLDFNDEDDVCQASFFDLSVNTFTDYENIEDYDDTALARYTECFGFIITANDTIADNITNLMEVTVDEEWGYYVFTVVDTIYILASGDQFFGGESIEFDISLGCNISIGEFASGRITIPSLDETGLTVRDKHSYAIGIV